MDYNSIQEVVNMVKIETKIVYICDHCESNYDERVDAETCCSSITEEEVYICGSCGTKYSIDGKKRSR